MINSLSCLTAKFFGEVKISDNTINLLTDLPTIHDDGYLKFGRNPVDFYKVNRAEIVNIINHCYAIMDIRLIDFLKNKGFDCKIIIDTIMGKKINPKIVSILIWEILDLMSGVINDNLLNN